MRPLFALVKREFAAYFQSPVGYATLFAFLILTGSLFLGVVAGLNETGSKGIEYPFAGIYGNIFFWFIFALIPPLLTMRLLAEERGTGTLEPLMTAPIRDWQVVAGKFIGASKFYLVMLLPTLLYLPLMLDLRVDWAGLTTNWSPGNVTAGIDPMYALATYLGLILVGKMFLAIGLYVSSLVKNQLVAAMIGLLVCLLFVAGGVVLPYLDPNEWYAKGLRLISVPDHFSRDFTRGVIDTRAVVLYVSVTAFSLFLTVRSLESRRFNA